MNSRRLLPAALTVAGLGTLAFGLACGGGGSSSSSTLSQGPVTPSTGDLKLSLSDASTEDWSAIGVKVLAITLTPQGGGTPVTVYTAPATAPVINLVQLDQISGLLGNAKVAPGTYTAATLTLAGNPGDVTLTAAAQPSAGFAGTPGAAVPAADIQIKDATGTTGSLTVPVTLKLAKPLVVTAGASANLDVEFVLSHPAFIVDHPQLGGADPIWTVNFAGTLRHNPVSSAEQMILRHTYGTVTSVAADNTSLAITVDFPASPVTTPETAVATPQTLTIDADASNGTVFHDLDGKTTTTITSFASVAKLLPAKYLRATLRFQPDGSLVAVRMWASSSFHSVWVSPEGHVAHVALGTASTPYQLFVEDGNGATTPVTVNNLTRFYFRTPASAQADAAPLSIGTGIMDAHNLVRGFKVHVSPVDPAATQLVAESVDIENAGYSGNLSSASSAGFTYTRAFATTPDNYTANLTYISATTANGNDAAGTAVQGFKWWDLTLPTLADTGANATADFLKTLNGAVNFGGTAGLMKVWGSSRVIPSDATLSAGWAARWVVIVPQRIPTGKVVGPYASSATGGSFTMTVKGGGATPVLVNLSNVADEATVIYQEDQAGRVYNLSPVDLTTPAGVSTLKANLDAATPVIVYGVPQADGSIKAYVLYYSTSGAII